MILVLHKYFRYRYTSPVMQTKRIGIKNNSSVDIDFADITKVAQALQVQIDRDFFPEWGRRGQIFSIHKTDSVPQGVWPMYLIDKLEGGSGVHLVKNHTPYANVEASEDWSVTASHELLEMLADPYGHRLVSAPSIDPTTDGHMVYYLIEVADPCEVFSYSIDSVAVSDFVTREYYNENSPATEASDLLSRLASPYEVPEGCYISWIDPEDGRWHQKRPNGEFVTGKKRKPKENPREDRDASFGEDEDKERHNLSSIRAKFYKKRK